MPGVVGVVSAVGVFEALVAEAEGATVCVTALALEGLPLVDPPLALPQPLIARIKRPSNEAIMLTRTPCLNDGFLILIS
ncbi:hypothetical protein KSC_087650 [Ktedonobacter sp. SOSP1-52]|nr:hypothetical protein KSC_087650 [Ktedonobacter sp. SOSP1-52]